MGRLSSLDARWLRRWTIRLGIVAAIVMAAPALTVVALISIVGLPLGIAMMATPTLFCIVALAYALQKLHGRDGPVAVAASMTGALVLLAGIAGFANSLLDRRAQEYLEGDLDTLERPLRAKSIGLVDLDSLRWSKGETRCDELCQRLLLSGAAERVLVADRKPGDVGWSGETPAFAFRFEPRASCPPVHFVSRRSGQPVDQADAGAAMHLAVASGRCLVEANATLADSDAVIATGRVHRGASESGAGLSLLADTMTVTRATVHVQEQGSLVERYRWTSVSVLRHPVIPVPTLVGGHELNMWPGFLRREVEHNGRPFAHHDIDSLRFVRDELGLEVVVAAASPDAVIASALDAPGPLQPALQQLIEDFFATLDDRRTIDEATRHLAFRALTDPRVTAPRETWALVRACEKAGDAVNAELAGILFRRIMTTDPELRENHPTYLGWPVQYLATAIRLLPPKSVLAHRRELDEIARDPARRRRARQALEQLPAFGADVVPTLLFLVDEGAALRNATGSVKSRDPEDWQAVYRIGLVGLCQLGSEASAALEPMTKRLREGVLPEVTSSRQLLLTTMVRLGADPELLRSELAADKSADDLANFDRDLERARSASQCTR
jgi:hypothetical protein